MEFEDLERRQRYAYWRRRGHSPTRAAEKAGYASDPPPSARRLATMLRSDPPTDASRSELRDDVEKFRFKLTRAERRLEAYEVLEAERPSK